jgi:hypothetical protein
MAFGHFSFRVSGFGDSRCSGRAAPLSLELPVAGMPKWLLGTFTFHGFRGFEMQWKKDPLSLELLVAEMSKWLLGAFRISGFGIPDAVEERTPCPLKSR